MGFSAALRPPPHLAPSSSSCYSSKLFSLGIDPNKNRLSFVRNARTNSFSLKVVSVINGTASSTNESGATEPARVLLERLFSQAYRFEEKKMSEGSQRSGDLRSMFTLGVLKSDLMTLLRTLKKKEEDLEEAEREVSLENGEFDRAKEELEQREMEIAAACAKHEELENELKQANLELVSQAREIEDLKVRLEEREEEVFVVQTALSVSEDELEKRMNELSKKREEAAQVDSELKSKARLLEEANEVVKKHEVELEELREIIREKEEELEASASLRIFDEEKLKVAEANLEKQTMKWLLTQEELKNLEEEVDETGETVEEFGRVKSLLADAKSELMSSQRSLSSSRQEMEEHDRVLKQQWAELEEHRNYVMAYVTRLKDGQLEIESERAKLEAAEAQNEELERGLSMEKQLVEDLREELEKKKTSMNGAIQKIYSLQQELERKNSEFADLRRVLECKESELVEAELEIQHLKSEMVSLELLMKEKDVQIVTAVKKLEEVSREVAELKVLMSETERELVKATGMVKAKDEHIQIMQDDLSDAKMKTSEAADEHSDALVQFESKAVKLPSQRVVRQHDEVSFRNKHLEIELKLTRESLKVKEMEVLAAQRALTIKTEELESALERHSAREIEMKRLKAEMVRDAKDLKKLYALAQESIGGKNFGNSATEKLQVEAATTALRKLAEMSRELLNRACLSIEADSNAIIEDDADIFENDERFNEVQSEVARLLSLTDQLVKEAGLDVVAADLCQPL